MLCGGRDAVNSRSRVLSALSIGLLLLDHGVTAGLAYARPSRIYRTTIEGRVTIRSSICDSHVSGRFLRIGHDQLEPTSSLMAPRTWRCDLRAKTLVVIGREPVGEVQNAPSQWR
jgi:hypothetical protein